MGRWGWAMPALLIRISSRPNCLRVARNRVSTEPGSRTSHGSARIRRWPRLSSLRIRARADGPRPVRIKSQPSVARAWAIASPMPRVAPVMSAICPRNKFSLPTDVNVLLEGCRGIGEPGHLRRNLIALRWLRGHGCEPGPRISGGRPLWLKPSDPVAGTARRKSGPDTNRNLVSTSTCRWGDFESATRTLTGFLPRCGSSRTWLT